MDIKKIIGSEVSLGSAQTKKAKANQYQEQEQQAHQISREGFDTVTISSRSRQLSKISSILEQDQVAREDKIAALKAQVQNGTYAVDTREVARSIISFAVDGEVEV